MCLDSDPDDDSSLCSSLICKKTRPHSQGSAGFGESAGRWCAWSAQLLSTACTSSPMPAGQKTTHTPLKKDNDLPIVLQGTRWTILSSIFDRNYFAVCSSRSQIPLWRQWPRLVAAQWTRCSVRGRPSSPRCLTVPGEAAHTHLVRHRCDKPWFVWGKLGDSPVCVLTWLGGWNKAGGVLGEGAGLCWTWRNSAICGLQRGRAGDRPVVLAASHAAALDGDGLGHVHAQQGAERLWLRGTHARHDSGLDAISTGNWTLEEGLFGFLVFLSQQEKEKKLK